MGTGGALSRRTIRQPRARTQSRPAACSAIPSAPAPRFSPPRRDEFAAKGFGGARVDAIALRAGTNKRMLYHYFGDKEALYLAVLEEAYRQIRDAETTLDLAHRDPEDGLRELALFTWRYFVDASGVHQPARHREPAHGARFLKGRSGSGRCRPICMHRALLGA